MALKPPANHPNAKPIVMFPNEGKGFSYDITSRGESNTIPEGYDRTINMTCIDGKILTPSSAISLFQSIASPVPPVAIVPWLDTSTPALPYNVILCGNTSYLHKDNSITVETDATPQIAINSASSSGGFPLFVAASAHGFAAGDLVNIFSSTVGTYNGQQLVVSATGLTATAFRIDSLTYSSTATGIVQRDAQYASATFWDDGAGVAYLYTGTRTGRKLLNRRTQAGVWTEATDAANQKAIFVTAAGGRLWKTINDYQINNFSAGTDPFAGTPSTAVYVGANNAKITALNNIDGRPIVCKEDGIYSYNAADTLFERIYPARHDTHNFPFLSDDSAGGLYTATGDGVLVHIERFGTITTSRPGDGAVGRDTPRGRITGVACQGDKIVVLMAPYGKLCQPSGLCVLLTTDSDVTLTDYTVPMTDNGFANTMDIYGLDTIQNGNWILVGADDQFALVDFVMNTYATSNTQLVMAPVNVSGGVTTIITSAAGTPSKVVNGTDVSPASSSTPFGESGQIVLHYDFPGATYNSTKWAAGTLSAAGAAAYPSKFWMRIGIST